MTELYCMRVLPLYQQVNIFLLLSVLFPPWIFPFLISRPPPAHPSPDSSLVCNKFSVFLSARLALSSPFSLSLVSTVWCCGYYVSNHYQSFLNLFFSFLFLNRRFINRQTVITVCALVRKRLWLKVKCFDKSGLRSCSVGHWETKPWDFTLKCGGM